MKKYNSFHMQPRVVCVFFGVVGMMYGCGESSSNSSDRVCASDLISCGEYCCSECNADGNACKSDENGNKPADSECSGSLQNCNGQCANLKTDVKNCGECGKSCNDNEICQNSQCVVNCADGYTLLNGECYDTKIDSEHCGDANVQCSDDMFCSKGACACVNGQTPDSEGRCLALDSDKNNCGSADNVCLGNMICNNGECSCPSGHYNCDSDDSNGCEAEVSCDVNCPAGQVSCGPNDCADLTSNSNHCGSCENACGTGMVCVDSSCTCAEGTSLCGDTCANLKTPQYCGNCETSCAETEMCIEHEVTTGEGDEQTSQKVVECIDSRVAKDNPNFTCKAITDPEDPNYVEGAVDKTECWGECIDISTDVKNCGKCGNACEAGQKCENSVCVKDCPAGQTACGEACFDLTAVNNQHCGSCSPCDVSQKCVLTDVDDGAGNTVQVPACEPVEDLDCKAVTDPEDPNYVEGAVDKTACWGVCVDVNSDTANCGACGNACKSGEKCDAGLCVMDCSDDQIVCGDTCTDIKSDKEHCGSCDIACSNDKVCSDGNCMIKDSGCEVGQMMCYGSCKDVMTDVENCGSCLNACGENEECLDGFCVATCSGEYSRCETGKNVFACFNLENSAAHCGDCGSSCNQGQKCSGGECSCAAGRYDCNSEKHDGSDADGCESTVECSCVPGEVRDCWFGSEDAVIRDDSNKIIGVKGACKVGKQTCDVSGKYWGKCDGAKYPQDYICDIDGITPIDVTPGADLNCNGIPDADEPCVTKCETKVSSTSYIGCEYWPVFLQNQAGYSTTTNVYFDLTLVISNPSSTETAKVSVFNQKAQTQSSPAPIKVIEVAPGAVQVETLVGVPYGKYTFDNSSYSGTCADPSNKTICDANASATSVNSENGFKVTDYMLSGSQKAANAFRVVSSEPIVVYQFNPYGKPETHSADASLLMPKSVLGTEYLTMGFDNDKDAVADRADAITVVAVEDDTTVDVTFKADIVSGSGVAAAKAGKTEHYTLKQFEVLNLSQSTALANSTGTVINANKKIEVFGGAGCGFVPSDQEACDHLEEQLFPTSTWGTEYAVVKTYVRNTQTPENEVYYILAKEDGTTLTVSGQVTPDRTTLNAGEKAVITSSNNFRVKANKPILVGQFMVGSRAGAAGKGDPSFILNVPIQQYRTEYAFAVPSGYEADYVTIVTPENNTIKYTGAGCKEPDAKYVENGVAYTDFDITNLPKSMFSGFMKHPKSKYQYGYLNLDGGTHSLSADQPFGVTGYGFFSDTSYGYPIGLDLKELNTN